MLKTLKRKIALVAVAALGAGGLSIAVAPSAFAANTDTVTGAGAAETNKDALYVGVPTAYTLTITDADDELVNNTATSALTAAATITAALTGGGGTITLGSVVVNATPGVANATITMTISCDTAVTNKDLVFTIDPDGAGPNTADTVTAAASGLQSLDWFAKPVVTAASLTGGMRVNANQNLAIQVVGSNTIKAGTQSGFVFVGGPSGGDITTNSYDTDGIGTAEGADVALSATAAAVTGVFNASTDTAGTYQGVYYLDTDYSGSYTVTDPQISMSIATVGAPATIKLTPTSTSIATSATTSVKVEILDAAGLATQLNGAELISVSANSGSVDDTVLDAADMKTGSKTLTFTGAATAATATITASPSALLVSQGVAAASTQVTTAAVSEAAAITVAGNVSAADAVTAGQVNTLATGAGEFYTYTVTVTGATAGAPVPIEVTIATGTAPTKTVYGTTTLNTNAANQVVYATADATGAATFAFVITEGAANDQVIFDVDDVASAGEKAVTLVFQARTPAASAKPAAGTYLLKSGAAQEVTVTVKDQFGQTYSNYLVRATSASVIAASATTGVDGTAKISLAAPTDPAVTARSFTIATVSPTALNVAGTYSFTYSAAGSPASISFGAGTDGDVADVSLTTTLTTVGVPFNGEVNDDHQVAAAHDLAADFTVSSSTPTVITLSGTEGVFFIDGGTALGDAGSGTIWNAGDKTLDVASGGLVYVYATKTGTHTITATAGTTTKTVQFKAVTAAAGARNVAITAPASTSVAAGTYTPVTLTVTDVFGNPLASATLGAGALTATITGAGLINGFSNSQGITTLDANGQAVVTVNALAGQSGAATLTVTGVGVDTGTTIDTANGPSFGAPADCVFKLAAAATVCPATHQKKNPASKGSDSLAFTVAAAAAAANPALDAVKTDVKAVSDTVATLSKAVTTIQSSVTELTSSFSAQIKSLSSAIAKISRAIAALSKKIK